MFDLFIKSLSGSTITIHDIDEKQTILSLKEKIAEITKVPVFAQELVYGGQRLPNNNPVAMYDFPRNNAPSLVTNEKKIGEALYEQLPEEFRKYISEHTQAKRHAEKKENGAHTSVKDYWNKLVQTKSPDCLTLFTEYLKFHDCYNRLKITAGPEQKKQGGGCSIM